MQICAFKLTKHAYRVASDHRRRSHRIVHRAFADDS
jgi:hypothetical protein